MSSQDISCVAYNIMYQNSINQIAKNSERDRTWTRFSGFRTNPLIALPTTSDSSGCGGLSVTYQERLLNKKQYILYNNSNNVQSGNTLTKAQYYTRLAKGNNLQGTPAKKYGIQSTTVTNPNISNLARERNFLRLNC